MFLEFIFIVSREVSIKNRLLREVTDIGWGDIHIVVMGQITRKGNILFTKSKLPQKCRGMLITFAFETQKLLNIHINMILFISIKS